MIVKFFIFLMQSDGVLLQQKSTANTDGCIYSAYSEIFLILYVFVFFYFFFILLPVLDGMLYNVTMVFLFIFQITAGARCIFVLRNFEGIGSGVDDAVAAVGGAAQGVDVETLLFFHLFNHVRRCTEKVFLGVAVGKDGDVGHFLVFYRYLHFDIPAEGIGGTRVDAVFQVMETAGVQECLFFFRCIRRFRCCIFLCFILGILVSRS